MDRLKRFIQHHFLLNDRASWVSDKVLGNNVVVLFDQDPPIQDKGRLYRRIAGYFKPYWLQSVVVLGITLPIGALDGAIAYSLKPFVNALDGGKSLQQLSHVPIIILGFTLVQGLFHYISTYSSGWLGMRVAQDLRRDLLHVLQYANVETLESTSTGSVFQSCFRDPESIRSEFLANIKTMLTRVFSTVGLVVVLVCNSWQLALVALISLFAMFYPASRINKLMRRLVSENNRSNGQLLTFYNETLAGIRTIYGYNIQEKRYRQFEKLQELIFAQTMKTFQIQGWLTPIMHLVASASIALIIWLGAFLVLKGELSAGAFVSFFAALLMLYNPLKNLGNSMVNTERALFTANRIFWLMDESPRRDIIEQDRSDAIPLACFNRDIVLEDVCFAYRCRPDHLVLQGINLTIAKGETIALVGASGGGKTTLASLIPRFYDVTGGCIRLDGRDIREYSLHSVRENMAVVFQDNFLFHGTIRENLLIGKAGAGEDELYAALQKAYLSDFIQRLPERLDTPIGERGMLLSGGQKQRLSLARAFLKDAPILILDEATSALDNQSEAVVQQALDDLRQNRTVIVIAHRLSTIRNADRIFVLDQGRIRESGHHEALLEKNGLYAHFYRSQFAREKLAHGAA